MTTKLCVLVVAAVVIWGMKRHYADARADDLGWILSPTARLVGVVTGTAFAAVPGEGYVSHERLFIVEKSCAGINFMIAAFGMLVFALFHRVGSGISGACVLAVSLLASYCAAVTLALPIANGAAQSGAAFVNHALAVLVVPPILIVLAGAIRKLVHAFGSAT